VPATVTIPAGMTSVNVPVTATAAGATPVTVTATFGMGMMQTAEVRVIDAMAAAHLTGLTVNPSTLAPGGMARATVTLDVPALAPGVDVTFDATGMINAPMTVHVAADALTAEATFTAAAMPGMGTLNAHLGTDLRTAMVNVVASTSTLVINEIDYDQVGTDNAEFVEVFNAGATPVDLADVAVVLVNGTDSHEYQRVRLSGTLAPGGYAVVANAGVMLPMGVARFALPDNTIQNGMPDGVALLRISTGRLIDALAYEGPITAAVFTGVTGTQTLVEGMVLPVATADSNTAPGSLARTPNGRDTDNAAMDWRFVSMPTPGAANP
jgi:hypothetical protein